MLVQYKGLLLHQIGTTKNLFYLSKKNKIYFINPLASPYAGAPALKYGNVNTETPSPSEVKGLIDIFVIIFLEILLLNNSNFIK